MWMVEARRREDWGHTSHLLAMIVNANPFRKGEPIQPGDLNPMLEKPKEKPIKLPFSMFLKIAAPHVEI